MTHPALEAIRRYEVHLGFEDTKASVLETRAFGETHYCSSIEEARELCARLNLLAVLEAIDPPVMNPQVRYWFEKLKEELG